MRNKKKNKMRKKYKKEKDKERKNYNREKEKKGHQRLEKIKNKRIKK